MNGLLKKLKRKLKKYVKTNENENTMIQNLWDAAKAVLKGKFIAIQSYLKKQEKQPNFTPKTTRKRKTNKT